MVPRLLAVPSLLFGSAPVSMQVGPLLVEVDELLLEEELLDDELLDELLLEDELLDEDVMWPAPAPP